MSRIGSDEELRTAVHNAVDDVTARFDLLERVRGGVVRRRRVQAAGSMAAVIALAAGVGVVSQRHDGGAAVSATGKPPVPPGDRVTVTFQTVSDDADRITDDSVTSWVLKRAEMDGLKGVDVSVRHSPFRLSVTGHSADLVQLKTLGVPGILQFRQVIPGPMPNKAPHTDDPYQGTLCSSPPNNGPEARACSTDHEPSVWVGPSDIDAYHVAEAHAQAAASGQWTVVVKLDPAGAEAYGAFTARMSPVHGTTAVIVDGVVQAKPIISQPIRTGVLTIEGGYIEQEARNLAAVLSTQGFPDLQGATVTDSTP